MVPDYEKAFSTIVQTVLKSSPQILSLLVNDIKRQHINKMPKASGKHKFLRFRMAGKWGEKPLKDCLCPAEQTQEQSVGGFLLKGLPTQKSKALFT